MNENKKEKLQLHSINFETDGRLVLKVYETDDRDSWK